MSCPETRDRLHAYLDDELDADRRDAFEGHLHGCPECSRELEGQRALRAGLRDRSFRFSAPAGLMERIQSAVRPAAATPAPPYRPAPLWIAAAAALLIGVVGAAVGVYFAATRAPASADLPRELTAAHVRSLMAEMADHLFDVQGPDRHVIKPWFQGKVDFSLPVNDYKDQGYPLKGGRLDYLDDRPVAALVYGRNKHVINLFIWPATGDGDGDVQTTSRRGYNLVHWVRGGLNFWAVSDLNAEELQELARLVREASP